MGAVLSPLLSNLALSVLDEHFVAAWESFGPNHARKTRRSKGLANYRLVRYADDWVVLVAGDRSHAEALRDEAAANLSTMGLRLSVEKTRIAHIDEGFDFLGRRIQRHTKRGTKREPSWGCWRLLALETRRKLCQRIMELEGRRAGAIRVKRRPRR